MIRHSALVRLMHAPCSESEAGFPKALAGLAGIPGVRDFRIWRETSPKNPFAFAVSMDFADQPAYDAYNVHPVNVAFISDRWVSEVIEFIEHDVVAL